jgi:hypothetical protein
VNLNPDAILSTLIAFNAAAIVVANRPNRLGSRGHGSHQK